MGFSGGEKSIISGEEKVDSLSQAICLYIFFLAMVSFPILSVDYFFGADGPAHLHSAHLFNDLVAGGVSGIYTLNGPIVPNSLGHWLMSLLLPAVSPAWASKITVISSWAGFVATVVWLRYSVWGRNGLKLAVTIGAVLGCNFIWLLGMYNFVFGVSASLIAIGLLYRWNSDVSLKRGILLSLLVVIAFVGHLVAFGVALLGAAVVILAQPNAAGARSKLKVAVAYVPGFLLLVAYQFSKVKEASLAPTWKVLDSRFSFAELANHLKHTDPLTMIGDHNKAPFLNGEMPVFLLMTPMLWFLVAAGILGAYSLKRALPTLLNAKRAQLLLMLVFLVSAFIAPDEFGPTQGSILRPRLLLVAAALCVPIYSVPRRLTTRFFTYGALALAFTFQLGALWEYSERFDREASDFLAVTGEVREHERVASVMIFRDDAKFHEPGIKRISGLIGIAKNATVWDNYETGYYFFPVVAETEVDRQFIRDYSGVNVFRAKIPGGGVDLENLDRFVRLLGDNRERIDALIVWGRDPQIEGVFSQWFGPVPEFESGEVKLFRARR